MSLTALTISEMRQGLLAGDFSALELVDAHLRRIEQTNEQYNSIVAITKEHAQTSAAKADALIKQQKQSSPALTGIPYVLKDSICNRQCPTTCASQMLRDYTSPFEATVVAKLNAQGAILLGKTNLDEFTMGSSSEYSIFGPVRNPWDQTRISGGSSGGSAVAALSGQAPLALGTDTGGSIRQPAAMCGIVGLKPTYGRVSRYGAIAHASSFDQIGPMARCIEDVALGLQTIAGRDLHDRTSMNVAVADYFGQVRAMEAPQSSAEYLKTLRLGVPKEYFIGGLSSAIEKSLHQTLERLVKRGAKLVEISLPHTEYALATYYIITPAEASSNLARFDGVRYGFRSPEAQGLREIYEKSRSQGFGPEVKRRILIGTYVLSAGYFDAYYARAQQARTLIADDFKAAFANHCDVIVTPVTPQTAFKLGQRCSSPLEMYLSDIFTVPVNLAGLPGLALPCGFDDLNLPIGMQLIAPPFEELRLLKLGRIIEQELDLTQQLLKHAV